MIYLKTDEEIELMRESNLLVGMTLGEMAKWIDPGPWRSAGISGLWRLSQYALHLGE